MVYGGRDCLQRMCETFLKHYIGRGCFVVDLIKSDAGSVGSGARHGHWSVKPFWSMDTWMETRLDAVSLICPTRDT